MPMQLMSPIRAIAGQGLEGDRYATGRGAYSKVGSKVRHVTLISMEEIDRAAEMVTDPFLTSETRRNLITLGVNLNDLVGKEFMVGNVRMRGTELCDPCQRPSRLVGRSNFEKLFANRGGLRAEILTDGEIKVGDEIVVL